MTRNRVKEALRCLESLHQFETICVDNASDDGTADAVAAAYPQVELIRSSNNLGFAAGNNLGIERALERGADWVFLVNGDVVVDSNIKHALAEATRLRPDADVLACKVYFYDDPQRIEYAGAHFKALLGYSGRQIGHGTLDSGSDAIRDVDRATGAAMAVSARAIDAAGLLNESLFMYAEDIDWCLRIRASGGAVVFVPQARVWHHGGTLVRDHRVGADAFYYHARNLMAVCEAHRPLPVGLRSLRRGVIIATHLLQARNNPHAMRAVVEGWRDYRAHRMGHRP